jgi:hypothetical protein
MKLFTDARWLAFVQIMALTAVLSVSVKGVFSRDAPAQYISAATAVFCAAVLTWKLRGLPR